VWDDQLAVRAEAKLESLARRCAHRFDGCANQTAKSITRARIGITKSLHAGDNGQTISRHNKDSAEIQLDSVREKPYRCELPSRQIRDRRRAIRNESKAWRVRRIPQRWEDFTLWSGGCFGRWRRFAGLGLRSRVMLVMTSSSPVILLPHPAGYATEGEAADPGEQAGDCYECKEVPQSPHERTALELRGEVPPGERCRADEAEKKRTVRGDVLDGCASQLIELGLNSSSRASWEGGSGARGALFPVFACDASEIYPCGAT